MGKFANATYMTLDGDVQNVFDWHFDYLGEEADRAVTAQLFTSDAVIMGRATYDSFSEAWPPRVGTSQIADRMDSIKKYVISSTLVDPKWNNTTVISDNVVEEVRKIKEEGNLLQFGYGAVTRLLLANGLLDELRIWLHPVLSGKAKPTDLIYRDADQTRFTLDGVETHRNGIIILTYRPTNAA